VTRASTTSLAAMGADVRIANPRPTNQSFTPPLAELATQAIEVADAVLMVTVHGVSTKSSLAKDHARHVLDTRIDWTVRPSIDCN
jgi:hypothetical protein